MNKNYKKVATLILSLILVLGSTFTISASDIIEGTREETVYGLLNQDGSVEQLIVTDHIQKNSDIKSIEVATNLQNVELLMKEANVVNNSESITFTTDASDIYYRGDSVEDLPISTQITYQLDGNKISGTDLAGKSGHIVVTIQQKNNEQRSITIGDANEVIYLPFETAIVMTMDNQVYENVEVSTGKVLDDGSMKVLTAVLTPGLETILGEVESDLMTDEVVIEADVVDYSSGSIYMTTICKLPEIDIDTYLEEFSDLDDKVDEFVTAGEDLEVGSHDLSDGVGTYFGKQSEAFDSFNTYLENDALILNSIVDFSNSMVDFNTGLQLYLAGVTNLVTGVGTLSESSPVLVEGMTNFELGLSQVLPNNEQTAGIYAAFGQLKAGVSALDEGIQQANVGALMLAEKTDTLAAGGQGLADASLQLSGGAALLIENTEPLIQGLLDLEEVGSDVVDGASQLADGVSQFKEEGIDTLAEQVESSINKLHTYEEKYEAILELVKEYNSFSGEANNLESRVTFILKTASIGE